MRIQVVGIEDQNYKIEETGYSFDGYKVHCIDMQTVKNDKQKGCLTFTTKVDRNSPVAKELLVGKQYDIYFDLKGKNIEFIRAYDEK